MAAWSVYGTDDIRSLHYSTPYCAIYRNKDVKSFLAALWLRSVTPSLLSCQCRAANHVPARPRPNLGPGGVPCHLYYRPATREARPGCDPPSRHRLPNSGELSLAQVHTRVKGKGFDGADMSVPFCAARCHVTAGGRSSSF